MLQIQNIKKEYQTGELVQTALDGVSLNLRDSEFVAILGPSGSGKTTFLNIIGGLDRYDAGDIIINGISTRKYTDRDWDSYRNHTIGFVFQSYNLIPHQTILSNVELALTISGISKSERKERAKSALEDVGLGEHIHKRPNQMSGGQMQRVAIARSLVNNPDILLADEPTGALDTETSLQIMELLKEVAKDRLVIMVTHNPELAEKYANRVVNLQDGQIIDDTNPFEIEELEQTPPKHENMGKASMSFLTALSLSFNNLKTKKARTLLTAFAGSIGIIGISLIMSLSNGVSTYIEDIQRDTMSSYPISIEAQSMDLSSFISGSNPNETANTEVDHDLDGIYSNSAGLEMASTVTMSIKENNLTEFKKYLDDTDNDIHNYLGENGITYSYDVKFDVFANDSDEELINTDGSSFESKVETNFTAGPPAIIDGAGNTPGNFEELMPGANEDVISNVVKDSYEVLEGKWPQEYDEVVLMLDENNEISTQALYELGFLPAAEYEELLEKMDAGEEIEIEDHKWNYQDMINQNFYLVPSSDYFVENENGLFDDISEDEEQVQELVENGIELNIVGIARPIEDATYSGFTGYVGYTKELTEHLIEYVDNSEVVQAQEETPDINVTNGVKFAPADDQTKINDTVEYLSNLSISEKAEMMRVILASMATDNPEMGQMMMMGEVELAAYLDQYLTDPEDEDLLRIYDNYISSGNYDDNMAAFGVVSLDAPSMINIYADRFEDKDAIALEIEKYNEGVSDENQITYTDLVALLMSSITTIINVISYVLIAFVAVSLVVSSIMIGIITYISVMERTKEIGILRAIGASKSNISQIFNAETFIIGLLSGVLGVGITSLLLIPTNSIIHSLTGITTINASLPIGTAVALIGLSLILSLIAGIIPSRKAAKSDPVIALRSE